MARKTVKTEIEEAAPVTPTPTIDPEERYSRQKDLVPLSFLDDKTVTIIGVGAIGRQVALQLAAMGIPKLQIVDFDTVETGNLAAQGFMETDLGKSKVEAVAEMCKKINSTIQVEQINGRFTRSTDSGDIVFCCVDKIDTRTFLWDILKEKCTFFVDGRMSAEVLRIITAWGTEARKYYAKTLFTAEEAYQGSCTAKTTIYSSNVIAGIMVGQLAKFLRHMPLEADIIFNLLTCEVDTKDIAKELAKQD